MYKRAFQCPKQHNRWCLILVFVIVSVFCLFNATKQLLDLNSTSLQNKVMRETFRMPLTALPRTRVAAAVLMRTKQLDLLAQSWINTVAENCTVFLIIDHHDDMRSQPKSQARTGFADAVYFERHPVYAHVFNVFVNHTTARAHGFVHTLTTDIPIAAPVSAWDKALFLFSCVTHKYDLVWLIEDDVLVPDGAAFHTLTQRVLNHHPHPADLTIATHASMETTPTWEHWPLLRNTLHLPLMDWHKSMSCAVALSQRMLRAVRAYARAHGTLAYHEALFNSLASFHHLTVYTPAELANTIVWRTPWTCIDVLRRPSHWFHPFKLSHAQWVSRCGRFLDPTQSNSSKDRSRARVSRLPINYFEFVL